MKDFIEVLQIFLKYRPADLHNPFCCTHDELKFGVDVRPESMDDDDVERLDDLGVFWSKHDGCWMSFRFGSC